MPCLSNPAADLPRWLCLALGAALGVSLVFPAAADRPYVEGEVLVCLSPRVQDPSAWLVGQGVSSKPLSLGVVPRALRFERVYRVSLPPGESVPSAVARLRRDPSVLAVQPNYVYRLFETFPDDPGFSIQWALHNTGQGGGTADADLDAPLAWDTTRGSDQVIVAVIDTGLDYTHPDLVNNLWINPGETDPGNGVDDDGNGYIDDRRGWDFGDKDNDPVDDHGHGTLVSGIIGAQGNNGVGVSGVCWDVTLMPLDAFDPMGESQTADLIEAIAYAQAMGARLINASWGDQYYDYLLEVAIRSFTASGGLFVCAAGNEYGENNDIFSSFPANYDIDALLSVGASERHDLVAGFSSVGANRVHLFAPGQEIHTTRPGIYGSGNGTSMATPMVVGVASLLWAWDPSLSSLEVKYRILGGVDKKSSFANKCLTGGRLNASAVFGIDSGTPAAVGDLRVIAHAYDRLDLAFTATGDDGMIGTARFLELRYSSSPITEANWGQASRAYNVPAPAVPGTPQSYTLLGLDEGTPWYIRMKVVDEVGHISPLSNEAVGVTDSPRLLFYDDVESGTDGWTVEPASDWARTDASSKSGSYSWTEMPEDGYGIGDDYLISPAVDLSTAQSPLLRFWHKYDILAAGINFAEIQASTDGVIWSAPLARYSNSADWWLLETLDLSSYRGCPSVRIRFHFAATAASSVCYGWYVDDIRVLDLISTAGFEGREVY